MPKCLECGFESSRLQWTHFKYKCTGRFSNGTEYMLAYPGAQVVDEDLKKRAAVTLEILTNKYGPEEGKIRWDNYRNKQAETNTFEYKKEKYGWTQEEFDLYNKSRAVTVENMIERHGLEEGIKKWEDYCEKQKLTKSKEYVDEKYGLGAWEELCKRKTEGNSPAFLSQKFNITIEEAVEKIVARYRCAYSSDIELDFVNKIEEITGTLDHTNKHSPYGRWNHADESYVVYDIKHKNKIVEFNGDYWHANPKIYNENDLIRGVSAKDIWEKDEKKLAVARNAGFDILVVWENDYRQNKQKIVEEVAKWILNIQK